MKQPIPYLRLIFAICLLTLEAILLSLMVDASTIPENGYLSNILSEAGNFLRWSIVSAGLLALFLANNFKHRLKTLFNHYSAFKAFVAFIIHLGLFVLLVIATYKVFHAPPSGTVNYYSYIWIIVSGLTAISWCFILAGYGNWIKFLSSEKTSIASAAIGGLLVVALGFYFQRFWGSMTEFTLSSTKTLLELFYNDIIFDASQNILGIDAFWVYIAPVCSGIEGVVLAVSIAAIYLYLSRKYFRFPQALILLPLAGIISIALNIVRITALIILGAEISPALAVGGFHSVAGWITAVLVALLIVFVFSSWQWILKKPKSEHSALAPPPDSSLAHAILVPFVIYSTMTLIGGIFTNNIDYFYPIKLTLTGGAVLYYWKIYNFALPDKIIEALAVGVLVALLWILMIPADEQVNMSVSTALYTMPVWMLIGWSTLRLTGFWVLAPILEELVFRGYLISRLSGQVISTTHKPTFSLFALIVSAVLFGLLHNAWLAGTVAGLLFAYVRFRSESITSCILAHSTANILVTTWAVYSGNWSLI